MRMVRLLKLMSIGAIFAAVPSAVLAQSFETGVKGGVAITGVPNAGQVVDPIVGQDSAESTSRIGLAVGGYVRFPINDRFGFEPEALFVMKGVQLSEKNSGGTVNIRLNYLDVPLLIRYRIPIDSTYTGYLLAGPNFGVKLSSSAVLDAPSGTVDEDIDPALKSLDLGLAFGGGIVRGRYIFEARFTAGLTDIAQDTVSHVDKLKNRTFLLLVGIKVP